MHFTTWNVDASQISRQELAAVLKDLKHCAARLPDMRMTGRLFLGVSADRCLVKSTIANTAIPLISLNCRSRRWPANSTERISYA